MTRELWKPILVASWLKEGGRLPNYPISCPLDAIGSELRILSWNGRGICMHDPAKRRTQGLKVQCYSKGCHVLCIQEVHGFASEMLHTFTRWLPGWKFVVSEL